MKLYLIVPLALSLMLAVPPPVEPRQSNRPTSHNEAKIRIKRFDQVLTNSGTNATLHDAKIKYCETYWRSVAGYNCRQSTRVDATEAKDPVFSLAWHKPTYLCEFYDCPGSHSHCPIKQDYMGAICKWFEILGDLENDCPTMGQLHIENKTHDTYYCSNYKCIRTVHICALNNQVGPPA